MSRGASRVAKAESSDPRSPRTREALLDALEELAKTSAPDGISVTAVTRRAGVSRGTFYEHFDGLPGVVEAAVERVLAEIHAAELVQRRVHQRGGRELAGEVFEAILERVEHNPAFFGCALAMPSAGTVSVFARTVAGLSADSIRLLSPGGEPERVTLLANVTAGAVAGAIATRLSDRTMPRDRFVAEVVALLPSWVDG